MPGAFSLTPLGHLAFDSGGDGGGDFQEIARAFASGSGHGLIALARFRKAGAADESWPEIAFWREFADFALQSLARAPESAEDAVPPAVPMPIEAGFDWVLRIPAMRGAEYASPERFSVLWDELVTAAREAAAGHPGGWKAWLASVNPALHLIGRVTFHLAENKRSVDHPFAFMATYTHRLGKGEKPVHLPLAKALQDYAGAKNQAALTSLLEPVQKAAEASDWMRDLLESRRIFQPQAWTPPQAHRFLREVTTIEAAGIVVRIPNWWKGGSGSRPKVSVRLGEGAVKSTLGAGGLLDFSVEVSLDGAVLTPGEIAELVRAQGGLVTLRGQWVEVDGEKLQEVLDHWQTVRKTVGNDGISFLQGMRLLAGFGSEAGAVGPESAVPDWSEVVAGSALRDALDKLGDPARAADFDPGAGLNAQLRPYQSDGVRWLWLLQSLGLGACLADDMGLGKTIQVIALLHRLKQEDRASRIPDHPASLLIAPASLIANWMAEIRRFAPGLRAVGLHPSETPPEQWKDHANARELMQNADLAITTYGQAARLDWLADHPWRLVVLDEAQAIKNPGSRQTKAVKRISARARIALSGTPVENRLGDLWSLYDFLNPGLLGGPTEFGRAVKAMQGTRPPDFAPLRRLVRPYLLRRLKTDRKIIADLPEKTEVVAWCALSKKQAALYQACVDDLARKLADLSDGIQRRGLVLAYLMRFKQICNHPDHWSGSGEYDPAASGKFSRLAEIVEEIASRQEKALVFTQFREMTEPLAAYLATQFGRPGIVLHGGTQVKQRRHLVDNFAREDGPPFFVLSLKAGGTGLNLTAASHVIHFDRWWNPAIENQATDRAFRIGQRRNVLVHKFVCRGTVEERIDALIASKKELAESVLADPDEGAAKLLTEMSDRELLHFVSLDIRGAFAE